MHGRSFAWSEFSHAPLVAQLATTLALATEQRERGAALRMRPMLSPKTQTNLKNAQSYFEEHLAVGDFYSEGEQIVGEWIGRGATALGLSASVGKDEFLKLFENRHPQTGERLTARTKDTRQPGRSARGGSSTCSS
jgi:hypothetical protein